MTLDKVLRIDEIAARIGFSKHTLHGWHSAQKHGRPTGHEPFPFRKSGKHIVAFERDVQAWIEADCKLTGTDNG